MPTSTPPLAKLYVEPTGHCNLACRTCLRNAWDEPTGHMSDAVFQRVLSGIRDLQPRPSVFFGGYGEPLAHPQIVEMIAQVKTLGSRVELITNGILLDESTSRGLISAGLDLLWVSIDGATPESYMDVRLGAALPEVLANLAAFRDLRPSRVFQPAQPEIGVAFVAMKRNIAELPEVLRLGKEVGAARFMVTNVLPYTAEMRAEMLYGPAFLDTRIPPSPWAPSISLPRIAMGPETAEPVFAVLRSQANVAFGGSPANRPVGRCPFIESGVAVVGWDGSVSPCLSLLHTHSSYLDEHKRFSRRWAVGTLAERSLPELWAEPEHQAFRARVRDFSFAPCAACGGCQLSRTNETDCYGNTFPTCGGCLWAQGIIQCP